MKYDGYIFPILHWDRGHVLLRSQYRADTAHAVEAVGNHLECTCEQYTIEKVDKCKHIKFVEWVQRVLEMLDARRGKS